MSKNQKDDTSLIFLILLLFGVVFWKIWQAVEPKVISFYLQNRYAILFSIAVGIYFTIFKVLRKKSIADYEKQRKKEIANVEKANSTFMGYDDTGEKFYLNLDYRRMHMQVVGTTNAGKTESVLVPLMVDDIEKKRGFIIIDGKSDMSLLNKLYAYTKDNNREQDFVLFSLTDYFKSQTYNPLLQGSVDQVAEKVIHSFGIENEFYRTVQFDIFRNVLSIFKSAKEYPTFLKIFQALNDPAKLVTLASLGKDRLLVEWATSFTNMNKDDRRDQISGLLSNLGYFVSGEVKELFNVKNPTINLKDVIEQGKICYFQLPVLKSPMLGKSVAKMVLQDIQSQISERHASGKDEHQFFGVFLDDFTEYLTKPFVSVLNKSRSANVGIAFAHQAIGDLEALGLEIKNQIQTNANIKVFMRTNEPESTEYFSKTIGTIEGRKVTSRQKTGAFGKTETTGDGSIRDVEEFAYHPNIFKRELGRGQGVVIVSHENGADTYRVNFEMRKNLKKVSIPEVMHDEIEYLDLVEGRAESNVDKNDKSILVRGAITNNKNQPESSQRKVG
jgi:type IV secretory pathway TraG/TraD family ATPase VirD4